MKLEQFNQDRQERMQKVADLKAEIEADQKALTEKQEAYETAVVDGKDKEADKLFPVIEKLKSGIDSKQYRLQTVERVTNEQIQKNAYDAVMQIKQIETDVQKQLDELDEKMKPLMQEQAKLFEQANKLKEQYRSDKQAHESLIDRFNLDRKELNKRGFNKRKEPLMFRKTKASPPSRQQTSKRVDRRKNVQELPPNATLKEIADANRIIQEG